MTLVLAPSTEPTNELTRIILATAPMSDREAAYHRSTQHGR